MQENIKNRKIYRICSDAANKVWDRINFLTSATSVDAEDGDNLEIKVGAIKGITTSTSVTEEGYAADAKTVSELNDSLGGISQFIIDEETGKIVGYKTKIGGNDMIYSLNGFEHLTYEFASGGFTNKTTEITKDFNVKGYSKLIAFGYNPLNYSSNNYCEVKTLDGEQLLKIGYPCGIAIIDIPTDCDTLQAHVISHGSYSDTGGIIHIVVIK